MKQMLFRSVFAVAAILAAAPVLHAQSSASAAVSTNVGTAGYIKLSSNAITFPTPSAAEFKQGYTQPTTVGLQYGANANIMLQYSFDAPSLTGSKGGSIAVSRIVQNYDGTSETPMSQFGTAWREGIAAGEHSETLTYVLLLDWSTAPQSYTGNLTYTISVY
jgi:hypothetical protein